MTRSNSQRCITIGADDGKLCDCPNGGNHQQSKPPKRDYPPKSTTTLFNVPLKLNGTRQPSITSASQREIPHVEPSQQFVGCWPAHAALGRKSDSRTGLWLKPAMGVQVLPCPNAICSGSEIGRPQKGVCWGRNYHFSDRPQFYSFSIKPMVRADRMAWVRF